MPKESKQVLKKHRITSRSEIKEGGIEISVC
jgi:hypothetical protein